MGNGPWSWRSFISSDGVLGSSVDVGGACVDVLDDSVFCTVTCDAPIACSADTHPFRFNSRIRSLSSALALMSSGESKGPRKQGGEMGEGDGGEVWVWLWLWDWGSSADRGWVVG